VTVDALNAVCPYYTMYPLKFPLSVLQRHGRPGEWVLDPFCGRGTTNFAARLLGMPSFGVDSSPIAVALAGAKLVYATPGRVVLCASTILSKSSTPPIPSGEFWEWAYHPATLADVCRLREALLASCSSPTRVLLRAIILGALHGPQPKGRPSYFSNQAPRTFAPKPRYAVNFWRARDMQPKKVNVLDVISERAKRYLAVHPPDVAGSAIIADSRVENTFDEFPPPAWVITSPPYYGMRTYIPDQWLRSWFLGGPDYVEYSQPAMQLEHTGAEHFAGQLALVWKNIARRANERTRLVIRFGGIHDRDAEPMDVLRTSLVSSGWHIETALEVPDADTGRRQVRQFQSSPKKGITEHDVYCRPTSGRARRP
jgi:DNA methylase